MRGRQSLNALMAVVAIALMTGVPVSPAVDHDDDHAHFERGHDGHDYVLMVEEGRVPVTGLNLVGLPAARLPMIPDSRPVERVAIDHRNRRANLGRDPPASRLPRPPPFDLS